MAGSVAVVWQVRAVPAGRDAVQPLQRYAAITTPLVTMHLVTMHLVAMPLVTIRVVTLPLVTMPLVNVPLVTVPLVAMPSGGYARVRLGPSPCTIPTACDPCLFSSTHGAV